MIGSVDPRIILRISGAAALGVSKGISVPFSARAVKDFFVLSFVLLLPLISFLKT